jgi:hypothetical protein
VKVAEWEGTRKLAGADFEREGGRSPGTVSYFGRRAAA